MSLKSCQNNKSHTLIVMGLMTDMMTDTAFLTHTHIFIKQWGETNNKELLIFVQKHKQTYTHTVSHTHAQYASLSLPHTHTPLSLVLACFSWA